MLKNIMLTTFKFHIYFSSDCNSKFKEMLTTPIGSTAL